MLLRAAAAWAACVLVPTAAALPGDNEPLLPGQRGSSSPVVDLGYARYAGFYDSTYNLNVWKSLRYAAPPVGKLRWQAPQPPPPSNCSGCTTPAVDQPPVCPQTGAFGTPEVYGFNSGPGNEDCLFLNVYAAPHASKLPVLVWIHGGGYSVFGASYDPSAWMKTNGNGFITVEIQYRLGAFGYLASEEIRKNGKLNAGLLDMHFALGWVKQHISKFGGDPDRVTIAGESSGAGSVMYMSLANDGKEEELFNNIIAASPYLPATYKHDDPVPTNNYNAFVDLAGCGPSSRGLETHGSSFDCLVAADTTVLQNASGTVSTTRGYYGSFAFLPVVDGEFVKMRPSDQLSSGKVSGKRLLVGNNANEGVPLTNPVVESKDKFTKFIDMSFPSLNGNDKRGLNELYRIDSANPGDNDVRFDTLGDSGPTALNQSSYATGIQQATFNIAGESTFSCPAQWLAQAFSSGGRQAWKYQYSAAASHHGADLPAYFAVDSDNPVEGFRSSFQKVFGSFIMEDQPAVAPEDTAAGAPTIADWPAYTDLAPQQMDFNITGGDVKFIDVTDELTYYIREGQNVKNSFRLVNALTWEGGRGDRCDFWKRVASRVPY